jgi:TolB-like protein/DNA-binding SARP family transcriptional activator
MVELRLLGTLQLSAPDGRDLSIVARQPKRVALLAYLTAAVPTGLQRRDTLLALFWPELPAANARAALSQALYVLRKALGEQTVLTRGDEEVGVSREVVSCDVNAFEAALDAGKHEEALALYRGELLNGVFLSDAPEFERWVERERERLRGRAADAAWAWAEARAAAKDVALAVRWARWAAALSPADEAVIRRLMTFLRRLGDRAAALRAYEAFVDRLSQEFELEPSAETRFLAEEIRQEHPPSATPEPAQPAVSSAPIPPQRQPRARRSALVGTMIGAALVAALGIGAVVWRGSGVTAAPAMRRIAVLPLANLTGDTAQEYFVDGMHDALITELAKIGALSVISRNSVLRYRNSTKGVPEIARELHVDAVVEGSVVLAGDSLRIDAQLIEGATDRHLWADSFVKNRRDLLALYGDVAQAIAREVRAAVTPEERARLTNNRAVDPQANDFFLRGRYYCQQYTRDGFSHGIAFFRRAIDQDPTFALAYAWLSTCYAGQAFMGQAPPAENNPLAKAAAIRALELDSTLGMPYVTLGWIRFVTDLDFDGPDQDFRRALELSPGSAWIRSWYALYLTDAGRFDEAVRMRRQALDLDPLDLRTSFGLGVDYFMARRYDEAIGQLLRTLRLEPGYANALQLLSLNYSLKGMHEAALALCDSARAAIPDEFPNGDCGSVYVRSGRGQQALEMVRQMTLPSHRGGPDLLGACYVYAALGDQDHAMQWLRRAARERNQYLVFLKVHPLYDPLRSDPRFQALLRELKMGS